MAPIDTENLSSNWKILQAKLKVAQAALPSNNDKVNQEQSHGQKRKRDQHGHTNGSRKPLKSTTGQGKYTSPKAPASRKRYKMEASTDRRRHHDAEPLSRSISMPTLKKIAATTVIRPNQPTSILEPHPDFPDVENEGISPNALPGKYVALDCEMVGIGPEPKRDSALARVSLVNFHGHQVYDSYVQIPRKIEVTDYRTAVSGIEPKHLRKDIARPFEEVRNDLKILLGGRILVGHAVKNDLDVLILKHERRFIRDTSKFSTFRALANTPGRTPGLKLLVGKLLGVEIQTGAHSSVEDARATMALYRHDKDDFEQEIRTTYGNTRPRVAADPSHHEENETVGKKSRNRRKKKKNS